MANRCSSSCADSDIDGAKKPVKAAFITMLSALFALAGTGCGDLKRANPVDPIVSGGLTLKDQLEGSWSRDDGEKNEVYTFREDNSVELRDYSSPSGAPIDRNASFPATRVRVFEGTYSLVGNGLTIIFTRAGSNDPNETVSVPPAESRPEISIKRNTLTLTESEVRRFYSRLQQ